MNESTDLIHGKIWKAILWFSIPMLVGNLFQQLYNTVDSYVVGNFVQLLDNPLQSLILLLVSLQDLRQARE